MTPPCDSLNLGRTPALSHRGSRQVGCICQRSTPHHAKRHTEGAVITVLVQMEVAVTAPVAGKVAAVRAEAGQLAQQGDILAVIVAA